MSISWQLWLGIGAYTFDVFGIEPRYPAEAIPCGFRVRSKIDFIDPLDRTGAIDQAKRKRAQRKSRPFYLFLCKSCCYSLLQTARVGLHAGQQICRLLNEGVCSTVRNWCAVALGSLE